MLDYRYSGGGLHLIASGVDIEECLRLHEDEGMMEVNSQNGDDLSATRAGVRASPRVCICLGSFHFVLLKPPM